MSIDIQHTWAYGIRETPAVKAFLKTFPDAKVYPLMDCHRKHRTFQTDKGDVFLYDAHIADDDTHVRLPVHGAAPGEDWLSDGPDYFVVLHRKQYLFLKREVLRGLTYITEKCPFYSHALYMKIPVGDPSHRSELVAHVINQ